MKTAKTPRSSSPTHNPDFKRFVALISHAHVAKLESLAQHHDVSLGVVIEVMMDLTEWPQDVSKITEAMAAGKARHYSGDRRKIRMAERAIARLSDEDRARLLAELKAPKTT